MDWVRTIEAAVNYIEQHITEDLSIHRIASELNVSPFYFQKGFSMLCGYTVGEYIRKRRLSLAGSEWVSSHIKVIDLAIKYGYDSPDSFTKAFTRFHGSTPTEIQKTGAALKSFAPLHIRLSLEGGTTMEYRIEKKPAFSVIGISRLFSYESANCKIPQYWDEFSTSVEEKFITGKYGICFDEEMAGNQFRYMIADDFPVTSDATANSANDNKLQLLLSEHAHAQPHSSELTQTEHSDSEHPDSEYSDFEHPYSGYSIMVQEIPAHIWAVFPCQGAMPSALQEINRRIFSEWLPAGQYEIAEGYNIEYYSDAADYAEGTQDKNYYAEVWIPVR